MPLALIILLIVISTLLLPFNPEPLSKDEIKRISYNVFEYSALYAPHNLLLKPDEFEKHHELFEKVASGVELSEEESKKYRLVFQSILVENQFIFRWIDSNITIVNNVNMNIDNNVGGKGIQGNHDHHDASTRSNLDDMLAKIKRLKDGDESDGDILDAKSLYKDTMDLLTHLGTVPQVKSTLYKVPTLGDEAIQALIEKSLLHFKNAQFANINSSNYWDEVRLALDAYVEAVILVQDLVHKKMSAFGLTLTGAWDSWKNLAPLVDDDIKMRPSGLVKS